MSEPVRVGAVSLWPVRQPTTTHALLRETVVVSRTGPAAPPPRSPFPAPESWECHLHHRGPRPRGGLWVVDAAASARLSGRGGGFFPAARKWRAALTRPGPVTVVANAAESETLSAKDAVLLRLCPHLVLDGLAILAEALDADEAVLWMHDGDRDTRHVVETAVAERRRADPDEPTVVVRSVVGGYLAGESSAIKHALAGGPPVPQFQGFDRRVGDRAGPSVLVHNVETLARLSLICRDSRPAGGGCGQEAPATLPGSRLLTVLTPTDRRVLEATVDACLAEAVTWAAGRQPPGDAAVLLAGFGGLWVRWRDVAGMTLDEPTLRRAGLTLGAGIVAPLWDDACGVAATAAITAFLARASARQCGPCLFGLPALSAGMSRLRDGTARRGELRRLRDDLSAIAGRGACHHPDGAVRLVRTALDVFEADVAAHAAGSPCGRTGDAVPVPEG